MDEMVLPMSLALPHLQPRKRKRSKPVKEGALDESEAPEEQCSL